MKKSLLKYKYLFFSVLVLILVYPFFLMLRGVWFLPASVYVLFFEIKFYSICILTAIWVEYLLIKGHLKKEKKVQNVDFFSGLLVTVGLGILGARMWHLATDWELYRDNFWGIFEVWNGGLGIFGAIIGGALGLYIFSKYHNLNFIKIINIIAVYLPLGQIIGRFGNFFNQEIYGSETQLPWGQYIDKLGQFRHPAFLYEQLGNLILFGILLLIFKKTKGKRTDYVLIYLVGYSLIRFIVEFFRDSPSIIMGVSIAQFTCLIVIFAVLIYKSKSLWLSLSKVGSIFM